MTYTATISHHSISRAREITIHGSSLAQAKRAATAEFGDGFLDHVITIKDEEGYRVSRRRIADKKWVDAVAIFSSNRLTNVRHVLDCDYRKKRKERGNDQPTSYCHRNDLAQLTALSNY